MLAAHYDYTLPEARIAQRPLSERGASKLLVARGTPPSVTDHDFSELPKLLPSRSLLIRNNSRVIRARIRARKKTGGAAEVFLLEPLGDGVWKCMIGGRRIRVGDTLFSEPEGAIAHVLQRDGRDAVVRLSGKVDAVAAIPLPPYIDRVADERDDRDYQTVYSKNLGSVAAPTAGLHMTPGLERELRENSVQIADLTLHVGAGTFAPLGGDSTGDHIMHEERASVKRNVLECLCSQLEKDLPLVALGTTSVRTLESICWLGVRKLHDENCDVLKTQHLGQWESYELLDKIGVDNLPTTKEALTGLLDAMPDDSELNLTTKLLIVPGYPFQLYVSLHSSIPTTKPNLLTRLIVFCLA